MYGDGCVLFSKYKASDKRDRKHHPTHCVCPQILLVTREERGGSEKGYTSKSCCSWMTVNTRAWEPNHRPKLGAAAEPQPRGRVSSACSAPASPAASAQPRPLSCSSSTTAAVLRATGASQAPVQSPCSGPGQAPWASLGRPGTAVGTPGSRPGGFWLPSHCWWKKSLGCINSWFALQG